MDLNKVKLDNLNVSNAIQYAMNEVKTLKTLLKGYENLNLFSIIDKSLFILNKEINNLIYNNELLNNQHGTHELDNFENMNKASYTTNFDNLNKRLDECLQENFVMNKWYESVLSEKDAKITKLTRTNFDLLDKLNSIDN